MGGPKPHPPPQPPPPPDLLLVGLHEDNPQRVSAQAQVEQPDASLVPQVVLWGSEGEVGEGGSAALGGGGIPPCRVGSHQVPVHGGAVAHQAVELMAQDQRGQRVPEEPPREKRGHVPQRRFHRPRAACGGGGGGGRGAVVPEWGPPRSVCVSRPPPSSVPGTVGPRLLRRRRLQAVPLGLEGVAEEAAAAAHGAGGGGEGRAPDGAAPHRPRRAPADDVEPPLPRASGAASSSPSLRRALMTRERHRRRAGRRRAGVVAGGYGAGLPERIWRARAARGGAKREGETG